MKLTLIAGAVLVAFASGAVADDTTINESLNKDIVADGIGNNIYLTAENIKVDGSSSDAVWATNGGKVFIGGNNTKTVQVINLGESVYSAITSWTDGKAGVGNQVNIVAKDSIAIKSNGYGIFAQSNTESEPTPSDSASVSIQASLVSVDSNKTAIVAFSNSRVNLEADKLVIRPKEGELLLDVRGNSIVNINANKEKAITVLSGDIAFETPNTPGDSQNSGKLINAQVNIGLSGKDSSWTGKAVQLYKVDGKPFESVELEQPPYHGNVKDFSVKISDGASWHVNGSSFVNHLTLATGGTLDIQDGVSIANVAKLQSVGGVVNLPTSTTVTVSHLEGLQTQINLATNGTVAGKFNVKAADEKASLSVNLMDTKLEKQLTADEINADQAKKLMANVGGKDAHGKNVVSTSTAVPEGMVNPAFGVDAEGKTHTASANTLMQSSLELASAAPLALNRIMMNDVRKRLGDIRTTEGTHGAWARYDGGKLSGEGGLENDFHTVQVGIDTVPTADSARMGVAFSYTDSDAEYARGSADMKAYSIAMYGTKVFDNGMFVDVIGRMGTADSDLTVDGQHKGTLDNVVLGVSGEFGWRFDITNSMYIEPQAELSYAYVNGDKLTLGTAEYDVDSVNSLLGRVGFAAGLKCPSDMGNVYVRASAVHEFLGDSKITGANAGHTNVYEIDGKDTWVEYGLGANFNVTKSTYMWADVERTTGGALDEDWRATIGVRYAW